MQLLRHYRGVVLLVVTNPDVDVIVNVANGDVGLDGYVHAIAILNVVDPDVDRFATSDAADVLLVVDFATLLDIVVRVVVVAVLHPFSPFDVLNPFHPFDVWNPLHPFDAVDVRSGANPLGLAHLMTLMLSMQDFPMILHDVLSPLMFSFLMSIFCGHSSRCHRACWRELWMKTSMQMWI